MQFRTRMMLMLAVASVCSLAATSRAVFVVNDGFQDGTRPDPASPTYSEYGTDVDGDGAIESAWFAAGSGSTVAVTPGHLTMSPASASSLSATTFFAPDATPITLASAGDYLKVTWTFSMTGVANDGTGNTGQNFRMALANSPSSSFLAADGTPAGGVSYPGYAMFMNIDQTLRRSTPFQLMERNAGTTNFLSTSGDWTGLASNGGTGNPGYADGTQYTLTWLLTRNASDGLDIDVKMAGAGLGPTGQGFLQVTFTDATPSSFVYDTFGIRPSGAATTASTFDTTLFQVETNTALGNVPEPASLGVLGVAGAALMLRRRRRSQG